jgi:membrane protease YdiL (CAAX protease family)
MGIFMEFYFLVLGTLGGVGESALEPFRSHGWPLWSAFLLVCVSPGVLEELAFRGYIQGRLGRVLSPREVVVVQAAMFSVLHMHPGVFVSHFVFGLALGWLRVASRSLYPGMLVHAGWNAWVLGTELL